MKTNSTLQPEAQIFKIISERTGTPAMQLFLNQRLHNDLGMDSLDILSLGCDLEKEFKITIADKEIETVTSINDLVQLVLRKLNPVS